MIHPFKKCLDFFVKVKPKKNCLYIRKIETSFFKDGHDKKEFSLKKCVTSQGHLTNKFVL